ncbi:MAG: hypothetical protein J6Z22_07315 [Lachnospiraceae bacterium]|nr:hypothetical protein [Lachnospiraceae bacterium]
MKKKYPILYLLEIPVEVIFYAIVVELGAIADNLLFQSKRVALGEERGFPYFTVIVMVIATILLIAAIIASIVNCVRYTVKKQKKKKAAKEAMTSAPDQE